MELISKGIIEALDKSGITAEDRIKNIVKLKEFIEKKNSIVNRLTRASKDYITNDLYQMILVSLDSHVYTFLNMDYFNPRRKSTSTVEQFFGQLMLLADGGSKLNCKQIGEILSRVMMTNALRMIPVKKKGFHFLTKLNVHMKSYSVPEEEEESTTVLLKYPSLHLNRTVISPLNSPFDIQPLKITRSSISSRKGKDIGSFDGNARKFFKTFK